MGIFERKRFVWNEPWFFQQRIRTTQAWMILVLVLLGLGGGVGAILFFAAPAGMPANLVEVIGLSAGFAAAVWWVVDGTETRRQAILFGDSIIVGGDMGKYSSPTKYKLAEIPAMAIVMPEESKWPEKALFFHYEGEEQAIGIDKKVSLPRLAQALHDAGVSIRLDGWEPNQDSEFAKAFAWEADPRQVVASARIEKLPDGTVSMMNAGGIIVAIIRQCWAIMLWLLILAGAIYYGYVNWDNLGVIRLGLVFIIPIGTMYIAGVYTDRFACAATSKGLIQMSKNQLHKRDGVQINLDGDDAIAVELFTPDQFANTVQKVHEMGFIQADHVNKRMLFEGKKQRWSIPAESIRSLAIEEVQAGTPGQSATGALNYYVVVKFAAEDEKEFGFRHGDRDFGDFDDIKRAEGGIEVFESFESLLVKS